MAEAGIGADEPCGLPEWEKFQSVLSKKDISLVVVSGDNFNTIVYYGSGKDNGKLVSLYLADGHYNTITHLPAFFGTGYVCSQCFGHSRSAAHHRCKFRCKFCGGKGTCRWEGDGELCPDCKITFCNTSCLAGHLSRDLCNVRAVCPACGQWYKKKVGQRCGRRARVRTQLLLRVPRHDAQGSRVLHATGEDVQGRIQEPPVRVLRFRKHAVARRSTPPKSMRSAQSVHSLHGFADGGGHRVRLR